MKQLNGQFNLFDINYNQNIESETKKLNIKIVEKKEKELSIEMDRVDGIVTIKHLHELYERAQRELDEINIPYSKKINKILTINKRATAKYGSCKKVSNSYQILVTQVLLGATEDGIMNTLIHELLHTCPGCMNHGDNWKNYAYIVNKKLGYNIQRTTAREEKGLEKRVIERNYIITCE